MYVSSLFPYFLLLLQHTIVDYLTKPLSSYDILPHLTIRLNNIGTLYLPINLQLNLLLPTYFITQFQLTLLLNL